MPCAENYNFILDKRIESGGGIRVSAECESEDCVGRGGNQSESECESEDCVGGNQSESECESEDCVGVEFRVRVSVRARIVWGGNSE